MEPPALFAAFPVDNTEGACRFPLRVEESSFEGAEEPGSVDPDWVGNPYYFVKSVLNTDRLQDAARQLESAENAYKGTHFRNLANIQNNEMAQLSNTLRGWNAAAKSIEKHEGVIDHLTRELYHDKERMLAGLKELAAVIGAGSKPFKAMEKVYDTWRKAAGLDNSVSRCCGCTKGKCLCWSSCIATASAAAVVGAAYFMGALCFAEGSEKQACLKDLPPLMPSASETPAIVEPAATPDATPAQEGGSNMWMWAVAVGGLLFVGGGYYAMSGSPEGEAEEEEEQSSEQDF